MSGWRPKTTRTGGLPTNVTFEPRILSSWYHAKNGVECLTGFHVYKEVVYLLKEQQQRKDFFNPDSLFAL
jgi:hypothetical protein